MYKLHVAYASIFLAVLFLLYAHKVVLFIGPKLCLLDKAEYIEALAATSLYV